MNNGLIAGTRMPPPLLAQAFNVKDAPFLAAGDGVVDDRVAIQAALDAANAAGGGIVVIPRGTYLCSVANHFIDPNYWACLFTYSNVTIRGAGMGATTIKLAPNQISASVSLSVTMTMNRNIGVSFDSNMAIEDITFDGNALNQGAGLHGGTKFIRGRDIRLNRVRAQNCRGTGTAGSTELLHHEALLCVDVRYTECEAIGLLGGGESRTVTDGVTTSGSASITSATAAFVVDDIGGVITGTNIPAGTVIWKVPSGTSATLSNIATESGTAQSFTITRSAKTSTGFSANASTNVSWRSCIAKGMSVAHGYTHNSCRQLAHIDCRSYGNNGDGSIGFNSEVSDDVVYTGCVAGGVADSTGLSNPPLADRANLGNNGNGWVINGTQAVLLNGCLSEKNNNGGMYFQRSASRATSADGVTTNGSKTITSATGAFVATDIGSVLTANVAGYVSEGSVITAINSTTSVQVSVAAAQTTTGLVFTVSRVSSGQINGGIIRHNAGVAVALADVCNQVVRVMIPPDMLNNVGGDYSATGPGVFYAPGPQNATQPAMPASNVYVANYYPFDADVYLIGGAYTAVYIDSSVDIGPQTHVRLRPNQRIAITHSTAPTWFWEIVG